MAQEDHQGKKLNLNNMKNLNTLQQKARENLQNNFFF